MPFIALLRFCLLVVLLLAPASADAQRDENSFVRDFDSIVRDGGGRGGTLPQQPADSGNDGGTTQVNNPTTPTTPTNPGSTILTGVEGLVRNVVSVGSRTLEQAGNVLDELIANTSGRLTADTTDVLINEHGICRWVDNPSDRDYFVPLATETEWRSFVDSSPANVGFGNCCMPVDIRLDGSNGNFFTFTLPIGRVDADNELGRIDITHNFQLERAGDGATWLETVSDTFQCTSSGWTSTNLTRTGEEPPVEPSDPGVTIETPECGDGYSATGTFSGVSEGADTDYTYPLGLQQASGVIPAEARNLRVYYGNDNAMTVQYGGSRHPLVNIRREGTTLYGEFRRPEFAFATMVENMGQDVRRVSWMAIACQPDPEPVADIVKISSPDCRNALNHGGACHWSGNGDDNMNYNPANYQWDNAMYACKKAGYNYMVAATGSDYDDCSGCTWYDWTDNSSASIPVDQLSSHAIPATNAGTWGVRRYGSLTNNGGMRYVWCSNAPNQRLAFDCNPTEMTINTVKVTTTRGGRQTTTTRTPATFTAQLPGGHLIEKRQWEILRPIHPSDVGTVPSSRRNDAHLYRVQGIMQPNAMAAESAVRYAECTPNGWVLYHACKPPRFIRGMAQLGTIQGKPGTATCTNDTSDKSFDDYIGK